MIGPVVMKAVVVLLFIAIVGIFAWVSRTCCDGDLRIERELLADLNTAEISQKYMSNLSTRVDHLDLVLSGNVEKGRKRQIVREISGRLRAGRVIDFLEEVEPVLPSLPSTVFFERKGSEVLLRGRVPNDVLKRRVSEIVYQMPVVRTVVNDLEVSERSCPVPDARLIASFGALFIKEAEQGFFEWSMEKFVMRGEVSSSAIKDRIEEQVELLLHGRTLENHLTISSTALEGVHCVVTKHGGKREEGFLRGSVGSAEIRAQAMLAARQAAPEVVWNDELGVVPELASYTSEAFPSRIRAFLSMREGEEGGFSEGPAGIVVLGISNPLIRAHLEGVLLSSLESVESARADQQEEVGMEEEREAQLKASLARLSVYFGTNQEIANFEELRKVTQVHGLLTDADYEGVIVVAGYAESGRNAADNKSLSLRRAESIKRELVKLGVTANRIEVDSLDAANEVRPDQDSGSERGVEIHLRD